MIEYVLIMIGNDKHCIYCKLAFISFSVETVDEKGEVSNCVTKSISGSERLSKSPAIGYQKVAVKLAIESAASAITYTLERDYVVSHGTPLTGIVQ